MDRRIIIGGAAVVVIAAILLLMVSGGNDHHQPVSGQMISPSQLYAQAIKAKNDGEILQAKENYQKILSDYPDFKDVAKIQKELEDLNMQLIFSNTVVPGRSVVHEVKSGDTLGELAKQYGTTIDLIRKSNRLSSDVIRIGQKLRIWTGTFNILVDKSQNLLTLKNQGEIVKVYDVSTGAGNITPVGEFKITSRLVDPVWFKGGAVFPPESPQNVLGTRWLGFDMAGYGIHGTIEPESIGKQVTAGCVRMRNEDVEELFSVIPTGTRVKIID